MISIAKNMQGKPKSRKNGESHGHLEDSSYFSQALPRFMIDKSFELANRLGVTSILSEQSSPELSEEDLDKGFKLAN